MKEYPQSNNYLPGSWKGVKVVEKAGSRKGEKKASFTCPNCGHLGSLLDHEIAEDGTVNPSVVCPYECGFHEFIRLLDWK